MKSALFSGGHSCPLCNATDIHSYMNSADEATLNTNAFGVGNFGSSRLRTIPIQLIRCYNCGLVWQNPMPLPDELKNIYNQMQDELYLAEAFGRRKSFKRNLNLLSRHVHVSKPRLLDVGCSVGLFLDLAHESGWDVSGIEPSIWAFHQAQARFGSKIHPGIFEEMQCNSCEFDVISMWDVLEHSLDPISMVQKAYRLLCKGGILTLNVPNIESTIAKLMGLRWPLLLPEHLYYFSPRTLSLLLSKCGFQILGFYRHLVYFRVEYIVHRLTQHGLPGAKLIKDLIGNSEINEFELPMLMGEVIVVAQKQG